MTDKYYNRETHKKQWDEIEEILSKTIAGFSKFNNFKPRKNGTFCVRCQYNWTWDDPDKLPFIGVGYFNIDEFKNFEEDDKSREE